MSLKIPTLKTVPKREEICEWGIKTYPISENLERLIFCLEVKKNDETILMKMKKNILL